MRARNCNQTVAAAIRKFGLAPVRAAVEMAVELQSDQPTKPKAITKPKPTNVVAPTSVASA